MASSTEAAAHPPPPTTIRDVIGRDDDDGDHFIAEEDEDEDEDEEEEEEEEDMSKRMSRLSMEGSDGGDADDEEEEEEEEEDEFEVRSDVNSAAVYPAGAWAPYDDGMQLQQQAPWSASLPGTPERGAQAGARAKEYASETEARWPPDSGGRGGRGMRHRQYQRRERAMREVWLERAWRARKQLRQQMQEDGEEAAAAPVVVLGGGGVAMDMEEVRACRDLGLDLPCDWTVEVPATCYAALSGVDTASSGGNSPASAGSWRISSPGDDPRDVKARLKVWAQAVALASASRLGS